MEPTAIHQGLNPQPPRLTAHSGHHAAKKQFWIIKHGIKMSGMPAWGENMDDQALWDMTAFVLKLPDMSAEAFTRYTNPQ
jgi:mono/diheme cytochrome c family protein